MSKLRVEGFSNLVRDTNSNAIVNVNKSEYQLYMSRYNAREKQSDVLRDAIKEINTLKQELFEIKKLLKKLKTNGSARQISATQTLEDFRTEFNALSANDFGDIATLDSNLTATSIVINAANELYAAIAGALSFTISDSSNTQTLVNGNTILFQGTSNQLTATVSATDTVTYALTDDVTIVNEFTASGTGAHTLGELSFTGSTIASSGSTITMSDDVTMPSAKTLTVDKISSNTTFVDFGSKNVSTDGFFIQLLQLVVLYLKDQQQTILKQI